MATVTKKRKVLSIKGKVKVIRQKEKGKKKVNMCLEFGLLNYMIQTIWKNRTELLVR